MQFAMHRILNRRFATIAAGAALFIAGFAAGGRHSGSVAAQSRVGQPKTVIHVVVYKWRNTASQDDKEQILKGLKTIAGQIPGVKNIWLKTERNQIRDFDGVYAIEFASPDAAADYAESPKHEAWRKRWEELRENSLSFQASN
jgi:cell division protein FtsX